MNFLSAIFKRIMGPAEDVSGYLEEPTTKDYFEDEAPTVPPAPEPLSSDRSSETSEIAELMGRVTAPTHPSENRATNVAASILATQNAPAAIKSAMRAAGPKSGRKVMFTSEIESDQKLGGVTRKAASGIPQSEREELAIHKRAAAKGKAASFDYIANKFNTQNLSKAEKKELLKSYGEGYIFKETLQKKDAINEMITKNNDQIVAKIKEAEQAQSQSAQALALGEQVQLKAVEKQLEIQLEDVEVDLSNIVDIEYAKFQLLYEEGKITKNDKDDIKALIEFLKSQRVDLKKEHEKLMRKVSKLSAKGVSHEDVSKEAEQKAIELRKLEKQLNFFESLKSRIK